MDIIAAYLAKYLPLTGGTMSGSIQQDLASGNDTNPSVNYNGQNLPNISNYVEALSKVDFYNMLGYFGSSSYFQRALVFRLINSSNVTQWNIIRQITATDFSKVYVDIPCVGENLPDTAALNSKYADKLYFRKNGGDIHGNIHIILDGLETGQTTPSSLARRDINFKAANGDHIAVIMGQVSAAGQRSLGICLRDENAQLVGANVSACLDLDGTKYAQCPLPRDIYQNDIVTEKYVKDKFIQAVTSNQIDIYVDPVNGSDTADLHNGRGFSISKAFKSVMAAYEWAATYFSGALSSNLAIMLLDDVTMPSGDFRKVPFRGVTLSGYSTKKKITLGSGTALAVEQGLLVTGSNLHIQANNSANVVSATGTGSKVIVWRALEVSGTVTDCVVVAANGGFVNMGAAITGNITGKKYRVERNGVIVTGGLGANAFAGSQDGTTNTGGVVV